MAVLVLGGAAIPGARLAAAPAAPEPSTSRYLTTATDAEVCDMGAALAAEQVANTTDDDAFVILHFFAPQKFPDGRFGASRYTGASQKISGVTGPDATGIELTLQRFANCYQNNNPAGSTVKIVAGVSNDVVDDPQAAVTRNHGEAWGDLIRRMNNWARDKGISDEVTFNGGLDAERGLANSIDKVKAWIDGYRASNGSADWNLFFYGDAAGCPSDKDPSTTCNWPANDIIDISWARLEITPFPQIYDEEPDTADPPTSVNAQQWQRLSKRSYNNGTGRMNFSGGLSQYAACQDVGGCPGLENRPKESWRDLWEEINCVYDGAGACVTADDLRWTTQLDWDQSA
ncbi:hypothetical protein HRbin12_00948 [bacterium HR12]|nr:hypothetical protein HRbin12_00948 [bacterium HR12]